ncbi:MAG: hypothetical protein CL558_08285 [Alphaproteobacteria bacterium]|nr:hypothetical protein [Alphaproteobacteria bacterium]MAS46887.1 hypothetical protein [Alphaproteobacteria bacterium]MAX94982.1 hypothetical protein [Alphaproteobacteria bacterium]MBN53563.1 hypothetical protein [Alphaproteobacteria bacterium]OUT41550.1 MAG: hypothetical protein CBB62_04245 [Micavibrio sp. TMED2]|tara:strand:- start:3249 stop:4568 length:1320 start_codon:yes stop_codon:yes gene_type:complete
MILQREQLTAMAASALPAMIVGIHALWSQPAPDTITLPETMIGLCLLVLVGGRAAMLCVSGAMLADQHHVWWVRLGGAAFLLLFWLGLIRGMMAGWPATDMLRDIIPLGFLFLAVLVPVERLQSVRPAMLAALFALAGTAFACRFLMGTDLPLVLWGRVTHPLGLDYLANSPLVSFGACYGLLLGLAIALRLVEMPGRFRAIACSVTMIAAAVPCWMAMATAAQRAPLGLCLLAVLAGYALLVRLACHRGQRAMLRLIVVSAGLLLILLINTDTVLAIMPALVEKSRLVGDNARLDEWAAIWSDIVWRLDDLFLGQGWGAHYASPAVGDYWVGYVHGLGGYMLLKAGLLGLLCLLCYLVATLAAAFRGWRIGDAGIRLVLVACLPPLLTGLLFYTSYKYLGYGLLLLLVWRCAFSAVRAMPLALALPPRADLPLPAGSS